MSTFVDENKGTMHGHWKVISFDRFDSHVSIADVNCVAELFQLEASHYVMANRQNALHVRLDREGDINIE